MPRIARLTCLCLTVLISAALCVLGGCGGARATAPAAQGVIRVKVVWPRTGKGAPKMIPASSIIVQLDLYDYQAQGSGSKAAPLQTILVPRPGGGGGVTQDIDVPVGSYSIIASAHAAEGATDAAQAVGSSGELIVALNQATPCNLNLAGTVTTITVSPPSLYFMLSSDSYTLTVKATDKDGNVVLLSPAAGTWNVSNQDIVGIDSNGLVTPLTNYGYATISYSDSEQDVQSNDVYANVSIYTPAAPGKH